MNVALTACILVVGGVVLPQGSSSSPEPGIQVMPPMGGYGASVAPQPGQPVPSPVAPGQGGSGTRAPFGGRGQPYGGPGAPGQPHQGYGQPPGEPAQAPPGPRPSARPPAGQAVAPPQKLMPFAPTDPAAAAASYPWGAPTSAEPFDFHSMRPQQPTATRSSYSSRLPRSSGSYVRPRMNRPQYRAYSSLVPRDTRSGRTGSRLGAAVHAPQAAAGKPFSNYSTAPTVSPYMELFRRDTGVGTDNYNSLVRPQLNQQHANRRLGSAVRGLQGTTQRQGAAIRNIGNQTGIAPTQRYMNFGGYYPSLGR